MSPSPPESDRRSSPRTPVSFGAVLYYNSLMLPGCELRNMSPAGAFVITDGQYLPDQAMVDLALSDFTDNGMAKRLSAQIVRSASDGVGVRLLDPDPGMMRQLVEMLYRLPA